MSRYFDPDDAPTRAELAREEAEEREAERARVLKVNDWVVWRGGWGADAPDYAQVTILEVTDAPREKHGREVSEAEWTLVRANRVVVSLDNGHWAYGEQLELPTLEDLAEIHGGEE